MRVLDEAQERGEVQRPGTTEEEAPHQNPAHRRRFDGHGAISTLHHDAGGRQLRQAAADLVKGSAELIRDQLRTHSRVTSQREGRQE